MLIEACADGALSFDGAVSVVVLQPKGLVLDVTGREPAMAAR
ncbi:hypothetical protein ACH41H_01500 [Streptomyces sp. NPDC020800]